MKKAEIRVGGLYTARVSGRFVTVRVDCIRKVSRLGSAMTAIGRKACMKDTVVYDITNLTTGRKTTFRSAAKFRSEVSLPAMKADPALVALNVAVQTDNERVQELIETSEPAAQEASEDADPTCNPSASEQGSDPTIPTSAQPVTASTRCETEATTARESVPVTAPAIEVPRIAAQTITNLGLAARIAAQATPRATGLTAEQEAILAAAKEIEAARGNGQRVMVIGAGAGTGKTFTLKQLEQVLGGNGQYTAFNSSLVAESKAKFTRAACNTTHSLAFHAVGRQYAHRLNGERMKSYQIARILGIESQTVKLAGQGPPDEDGKPTDKLKVLQADFLAGQVITAVKRFCQSADATIGANHLRYIDGIDVAETSETHGMGFDSSKRGRVNNDRVRDYLLPFCQKAWADLSRLDGQLPFSHDCYVKLWQLGQGKDRPVIAADYILLDEAQDTAPVFLDILKQQTQSLLIFVGDSNQAIYEWRGAVDAMKAYPNATRRLLSQSFRFGQAVADVANAVLATLDDPTDLVMRGTPTIPSRVAEVTSPRCYLYRTNAGAVGRVMTAIAEGKRPHLIGGGDDVVKWMQATIDLQAKRGTRHPELCCFDTWAEVQEYSKTDEGGDMRLMVKLVEEFGAAEIRDALKDMPTEKDADLVTGTAHRSKGREWDTVRLGLDFPTANKMSDADRQLLYVAATRAKLVLDISECPPFCGGKERNGEGDGDGWVPGIPIHYTAPMPTADDVAEYTTGRAASSQAPGKLPCIVPPAVTPAPTANGNGAKGEFTWASMGGAWCIRGPQGQAAGARVTVVRKNGSTSEVTLGTVTRKLGECWFYAVR